MGIGRAVAAAAIGITGIGLLAACGWNTRTYTDGNDVEQSFSSVRFANDSGDVTIRTGTSRRSNARSTTATTSRPRARSG